ncbi:preprotein translocase subunit YajC [Gynuella sp.]|uniref:preprotein translocase subunit YajC n=1 Tax=Gynuella sp. TaxID=2969146 RepID=UPI003D10786C
MKKLLAVIMALVPSLALAADPAAQPPAWSPLIMLGVFVVIFYLMVWRPQSKRNKEHKDLITNLGKGDEVVTSGGICGKITKVTDDFIVVEVSEKVEMKFQKSSIHATLPKGTLKAI